MCLSCPGSGHSAGHRLSRCLHTQDLQQGGAGSCTGGTRLTEIPRGTCTAERVALNTTLCCSTRPALFTKRGLTGPGLSTEQPAKVLGLLPAGESKLSGSQEQIMCPVASGAHLGTEQAPVAAGFGVSKEPWACLMPRAADPCRCPCLHPRVRAGTKGRVLKPC